mmetsp:Transcript_13716/g.40059  ORF Transcript_13716/g.40059 Transcript_13716/m.40059 type:complete len:441 (-) Transcript_13716:429-1751(-)
MPRGMSLDTGVRAPIGVNADPARLEASCPSRRYKRCLLRELQDKYPVVQFDYSLANRSVEPVRGSAALPDCGSEGLFARREAAANAKPASCVAPPSVFEQSRVLLLLGVPSSPTAVGAQRRDAIRRSWMKEPMLGYEALACFVLSAQTNGSAMEALQAEARERQDLLFVDAPETGALLRQPTRYSCKQGRCKKGRGMPTFKQYAFFQHAAAHLPDVPFVGKVDDDTAVNLPQLLPLLQHAACLPHALVGAINWAASVPAAHRSGVRGDRCGFGWSRDAALSNFGRSWGVPRTKGFIAACDDIGAVPTFPYATGAGYVFSAKLLAWVASSPEVRGWVAEARGPGREALQWQKYEDTSTGYWLTYAPFRVEYVNVGRWVHDFRCDPLGAHKAAGGGLYRPASPASLLVHNLKNGGFNAAFEQMQGAAYDHRRCMHDPLTDRV